MHLPIYTKITLKNLISSHVFQVILHQLYDQLISLGSHCIRDVGKCR